MLAWVQKSPKLAIFEPRFQISFFWLRLLPRALVKQFSPGTIGLSCTKLKGMSGSNSSKVPDSEVLSFTGVSNPAPKAVTSLALVVVLVGSPAHSSCAGILCIQDRSTWIWSSSNYTDFYKTSHKWVRCNQSTRPTLKLSYSYFYLRHLCNTLWSIDL